MILILCYFPALNYVKQCLNPGKILCFKMNDSSANESAGTSRGILNATSYSLNNDGTFDESELCDERVLQLMDKPFSQLVDGMQLRKNDRYAGFDNNAGDIWIYPTNYPVRKYQFSIVRAALFKNTMVVLPTGLGKTFIAAVVMYNIYRWYPTGKVIFMAPTRPLVNQQIEACYKIMGIPKEDTAEMTGKQQRKNRTGLWQSKRVFYVTPQVVLADINSPEQNFPTDAVKLVVIDEAHKAKGRYAYTEVIKAIATSNSNFRVLALSATPGRTLEDVAEVIKNLLISHIEVRWENSIDVSPYTFKKNIRTVVTPLGPKLTRIREQFIHIVDPYVRRLLDANVISGHTGSLNRGWLIMEQKKFRENSLIQRHPNYSSINADFLVCVSLYHAMELLTRHGIRAFLNFFEDEHNRTEERYFVAKDPRLKVFLDELREEYGRNPLAILGAMPNGVVPKVDKEPIDFGHPKFTILERNLKEHFKNNPDSKVIIFCEYRESVAMIHRLLLQNRPVVKPKCIVGQGGTGGGLRAVTQKEQIAAMKDFRSGACNTLIATCVAEEGIDVGEVDLIVCFDITKNPTRFVQRIGRTGRQRVGRVLMLVTEGKEHDTLKEVLASKDKINQKLSRSKEILGVLYRQSPRLVPTEFDPKCVETFIKIPEEVESVSEPKGKKGRKRKKDDNPDREEVEGEQAEGDTRKKRKKKQDAPRGTQDVRNFFRKVDTDLDASEREVFSSPPKKEDASVNSIDTSRGSFKAPQDASLRLGKTNQEMELEKLIKPLLRHKARFERERFLNDRKQLVVQEDKASKSILCPNPLKRLLLEANLGYLKEVIEKSEILHAAVGEDEDDDLILLDDRGDCLKSELRTVEGLFNGRDQLKKRISDIEEYRAATGRLHPRRNVIQIDKPQVTDDQVSRFNEHFSRFSAHSLNSDRVQQVTEVNEFALSPVVDAPEDPTISNLFDSQLYLPAIMEPDQSRYFPNLPEAPAPPEVTPINRNKTKSRVATLAKSEKRTPADYNNSPLLRAFNRSIQKARNSDHASPLTSRPKQLNTRMVLEYFGLGNLDQVFEESPEKPTTGNKFLDRLDTFVEDEEPTVMENSLTQQIADLSKSLFDSKELNLQAQEAAFLAGDFNRYSQPIVAEQVNPEEDLARKEVELLQADFMEGDFSGIEASTKQRLSNRTQVPIDEFLRENFPDDKTQAIPLSSVRSHSSDLFPLSASKRQKKDLELDIHGCLSDLVDDGGGSEEAIPNSQEIPPNLNTHTRRSQLKNLDVGNLLDLLADSDDDLFSNSEGSKKTPELPDLVVNSGKIVNYDLEDVMTSAISQKENIPNEPNLSWKMAIPTTPTSSRKSDRKEQESPQFVERSPSLLRKKLNFNRLRLNQSNDNGKLNVNSAPVVRAHSGATNQQSPFFASCRPGDGSSFRQELERQFGFQQRPTADASQEDRTLDDLTMIVPRSKRKAIVSSDDSEEDDAFEDLEQRESDEEDDVFQTARSNVKSSAESKQVMMGPPSLPFRPRNNRRKRKERCDFFLSQAVVSDDDDDDEHDSDEGLSQFVDDSIIDHGPVEDDDPDDMQAKYLQSVRSPLRPGCFKIPAAPARVRNMLDIYSQPPHLDQQSMYEMNSFIVPEEEEDEEQTGVKPLRSPSSSELDELERAEAILRERRRARRMEKRMPKAKRRRKIVSLGNDEGSGSSDEGEELKAFRRQIQSLPSD
ncbi:uncharacterized protein LOC135698718 [Ochlerotatus camptorhynchus]|uniref:uncharacterized protein LOC135698718 n=1 Tax=Ochlerotatus camptorhynchus TaxID=644619 RepID=UPI0031DEF2A8